MQKLHGIKMVKHCMQSTPLLVRFCHHDAVAVADSFPERTALYNFHLKHGGKIVNFGGFALPVQYLDQGIVGSHLHTRKHASIFDVSHMLQTYVQGADAIKCFESICTADIKAAADGSSVLTIFTNDIGGILDDLIVTRINEKSLFIVSNAAMKKQDKNIMSAAVSTYRAAGKDVAIDFLSPSQQSLIAVQGPKAVITLSKLIPKDSGVDLTKLYFMNSLVSDIAGIPNCRITRCGYTGEDGVELSIPSESVVHVTQALLDAGAVDHLKMAGLGARDSLRLEAGLCLYGTDIDANTTAAEAGLAWLVAKRRRTSMDFPGAAQVCAQLSKDNNLWKKRRFGFKMLKLNTASSTVTSPPPPARAAVEIYSSDNKVGYITSGCPSPSLSENIAMGYIEDKQLLKSKTNLHEHQFKFKIRNKFYDAILTSMPFIKPNYYTKSK